MPLLDALFRLLGLRRLLILADWFIVGAFPGALTAILAPTLPHLLGLLSPADVPYVGFLLFPSTLILSSALQNLPIAFSTWAVTALPRHGFRRLALLAQLGSARPCLAVRGRGRHRHSAPRVSP